VLELNPDLVSAYSNLGFVLLALGRGEESEDSLRRAIDLDPNYASAHCNLGFTLREMGHLVEAEDSLRRALDLKPDMVEAYNAYGLVLMGLGHFDEAESSMRRALQLYPGDTTTHDNLLFLLAASARLSPGAMLEEQRRWDAIHGREGRVHAMPARTVGPATGRKLRVGYVSPDFRRNVVSYFFTPLLAAHDRARFEIFCYASHRQNLSDDTTERLQAMADHWRYVDTISDNDLARLIHEDAIDILVDLTGHLKGNRLKAFIHSDQEVLGIEVGISSSVSLRR